MHAGHRGDIDDDALLTFDHMPPNRLAEEEDAIEIDTHHGIPTVQADLFHWGTKARPMIVDQDIDAAEFLECPLDDGVYPFLITHIHREG